MVDFFKVLEVSYQASEQEIQRAFRGRIKALHPDTGVYEPELFSRVVEAYQVLSLRSNREKHLRDIKASNPSFHPRGFLYLPDSRLVFPNRLDVILKKIKIFDKKRYCEASADFNEDLFVLLRKEEAEQGVFFRLALPVRQVCPECFGSLDDCPLCEGRRGITSSYPAEFELDPPILHGELFNLSVQGKPFKGAYYLTKMLKVRAQVLA